MTNFNENIKTDILLKLEINSMNQIKIDSSLPPNMIIKYLCGAIVDIMYQSFQQSRIIKP